MLPVARRHLLLLGLPGSLHAETPLKIYGDDHHPPFTQLLQGRPQGLLVDRLQRASARLEPGIALELTGWRRAMQLAQLGHGGLVGVSYTLARARWLDYSRPLAVDEVHLVSRRDQGLAPTRLQDLQGLRIGVGNGISYGQEFEAALASGLFQVERDWGPLQRLRMVLAGRLHGVLLSGGVQGIAALIAQDAKLSEQREALAVSPRPLLQDPLHLGLPKAWRQAEWLARFDAAAAEAPR